MSSCTALIHPNISQNNSPKEAAAQVSFLPAPIKLKGREAKTFEINFQLTIKSKQIDLLVYLKINKTSKLDVKSGEKSASLWISLVKEKNSLKDIFFLFIETFKSFLCRIEDACFKSVIIFFPPWRTEKLRKFKFHKRKKSLV